MDTSFVYRQIKYILQRVGDGYNTCQVSSLSVSHWVDFLSRSVSETQQDVFKKKGEIPS